jgi:hypothetical protein
MEQDFLVKDVVLGGEDGQLTPNVSRKIFVQPTEKVIKLFFLRH